MINDLERNVLRIEDADYEPEYCITVLELSYLLLLPVCTLCRVPFYPSTATGACHEQVSDTSHCSCYIYSKRGRGVRGVVRVFSDPLKCHSKMLLYNSASFTASRMNSKMLILYCTSYILYSICTI